MDRQLDWVTERIDNEEGGDCKGRESNNALKRMERKQDKVSWKWE